MVHGGCIALHVNLPSADDKVPIELQSGRTPTTEGARKRYEGFITRR
jgi:hypothetical protein